MSTATQTDISTLKNPPPRELAMQDLTINMFSLRGFELAQRIAKAFSTSDAVPAIFRSHTTKKDKDGNITVIENPSAIGNCIVAIETAQAVGMSITAVMQNANVIEGRLTWSGQFKIAAINASRRFTPLRFQMINKGNVVAKYREKQGWNNQKKGFDFVEREMEINNIECIAWALPYGMKFPENVTTLQQAVAAGLPVIEGAPVSMEMSVEEGWFSKPGSKWQTSMRHLMLQYRAGSFFGNIHAPDVVMGMTRTTEEVQDIIDFTTQQDGSLAVDISKLRTPEPAAISNQSDVTDTSPAQTSTAAGAADENSQQSVGLTFAKVADSLNKATDIDVLDVAADLISQVQDDGHRAELSGMYHARREALLNPVPKKATLKQASIPNVE